MKKLIFSMYIYFYNFGKRFNNEDTRIIVLFQIVYMFSFIGLGISLFVLRLWRMMYNEAPDFKFIYYLFIAIGIALAIWLYVHFVRNRLFLKMIDKPIFNNRRAKIIGAILMFGPIAFLALCAY